MSYKIVRHFFRSDRRARVIKRGLTLQEAQAHCQNPETSSSTCTTAYARRYTDQHGAWFDGYEEEKRRRPSIGNPPLTSYAQLSPEYQLAQKHAQERSNLRNG